jgi:hypothetical protein
METEEDNLSYGPYLQAVRVKRGISIEAVSARTRIRPGVVRAIEEENTAALPAPVFVKGFIKAIAEAIGADPQAVLDRYPDTTRTDPLKGLAPGPKTRGLSPSFGTLLLAILVIFVLAAVAVVVGRWGTEPAPTVPPPSVEAQEGRGETATPVEQERASVPPPPPSPPPAPEPAPPEAVSQPRGHVLRVFAFEDTWMKVIRDEEKPVEYFMKSGDELELEARSVYNILIGNAGGVRLELDGKPVPVTGKSGQVVTLKLP